jgi:hypothetical protein
MSTIDSQEVDFIVLSEDFSRYLIHDGTIIKAKVVVRKIFFNSQKTPEGYPAGVGIDSINAVAAMIPTALRGPPSTEQLNPQVDKGQELKFEEQDVKTQEYMTTNGFKITVKPILTKVFRYQKYNNYGEPIYNVVIQAITNIEKIESTGN